MDTKTGMAYRTMSEAQQALRAQGVPEEEISKRLRPVKEMPAKVRLALVGHYTPPKNMRRKTRRLAAKGGR